MPRTIKAQHAGATFTRKTDRVYTHVVLGRLDVEKVVAQVRRHAADHIARSWPYFQQVAAGTYEHMRYVSPEEEKRAARFVEIGLEAAQKEHADKHEADVRKRRDASWEALAWAGRPDLAAKQVEKWRAPINCMAEVVAVPVQA